MVGCSHVACDGFEEAGRKGFGTSGLMVETGLAGSSFDGDWGSVLLCLFVELSGPSCFLSDAGFGWVELLHRTSFP